MEVGAPDRSMRTVGAGSVTSSPDALRQLLSSHTPRDSAERRSQQRILDELDRLDRPWDREADPVHLTGSGIVTGVRGSVLHHHRRLHRWLQPGGHIELGEAPSDAALRESEEETGLVLSHPVSGPVLIHVDVHPSAAGHTHLDLRYLLVAGSEDPSPPPGESPLVRWFEWEAAEAVADDALRVALSSARAWRVEHRLDGR